MSSRRRLYLNLKQGIVELFKTPARYLKEITEKQSIFEKPYLDNDYRAMHLKPSRPSWGDWGDGDGPSIWPLPRKHTFVFDDGICGLSGRSGGCGETITLHGWIGATPPGSREKGFSWSAGSTNKRGARVVGINTSLGGLSASIRVELGNDFTGTVTICASAAMIEGSFLKEIAFEVPAFLGGVRVTPGWSPSFDYAAKNLPMIYEQRSISGTWRCGCIDLEVTCLCEGAQWDSDNSDETVAASSSCSVAIMNAIGQRTWTVSGTGAWLDSGHTITSLTNTSNAATVYTDASACGSITVTACGASGVVRCSVGEWIQIDHCEGGNCSGGACNTSTFINQYNYYEVWCGAGDPSGCGCIYPCEGKTNCVRRTVWEWFCP